MDNKEHIAYEGTEYTIEWYYDSKGKSDVLAYFESLEEDRQDKALHLFKLMGDMGQIRNETKFRNEGDGIYAFKPKPDRFLCFFFSGQKIIVTNAFEKKQDKLPQTEKDRAIARYNDFKSRLKAGKYYDKTITIHI